VAAATTTVVFTYRDGGGDEVEVTPLALVAAERHFKGQIPRVEGTLWAAWFVLGKNGNFDDWLAGLKTIDEREDEVAPFDQAPSGDS
jgi:hypothetical protein